MKKTNSYLKKELSLKIIDSLNRLFFTTSYPKYIGFKILNYYIHITGLSKCSYSINTKLHNRYGERYVDKKELIFIFINEFSLLELQYIKNYVKLYFSL